MSIVIYLDITILPEPEDLMQVYVALPWPPQLCDSEWRERDALLGPGILLLLSSNDGRVEPIIIFACMHKFHIIRVKLSSHSLLVGVMHSRRGQSSFGMFL